MLKHDKYAYSIFLEFLAELLPVQSSNSGNFWISAVLGNCPADLLHATVDSLRRKRKLGLYTWTVFVFYMPWKFLEASQESLVQS